MVANPGLHQRAGDRASREARFAALVDDHGTRLLRLAALITRDRQLAEDACQESFTQAWKHFDRLEADPSGWLSRVTVNQAIAISRRRQRAGRLVERAGRLSSASAQPDSDLRLDLGAALDHLNPELRAVLVLRYFADLSVEATAHAAGVPVDTAKSRLKAALREMRRLTQETEI